MTKPIKIPFQADPEQLALMPECSGNSINGLGEADVRPPKRVYWHKPDAIAHGNIQRWMVDRFNRVADFKNVYAEGDRGPRSLDPVSPDRDEDSPAGWSDRVKTCALQHEADLVAIARLDPNWLYADD